MIEPESGGMTLSALEVLHANHNAVCPCADMSKGARRCLVGDCLDALDASRKLLDAEKKELEEADETNGAQAKIIVKQGNALCDTRREAEELREFKDNQTAEWNIFRKAELEDAIERAEAAEAKAERLREAVEWVLEAFTPEQRAGSLGECLRQALAPESGEGAVSRRTTCPMCGKFVDGMCPDCNRAPGSGERDEKGALYAWHARCGGHHKAESLGGTCPSPSPEAGEKCRRHGNVFCQKCIDDDQPAASDEVE